MRSTLTLTSRNRRLLVAACALAAFAIAPLRQTYAGSVQPLPPVSNADGRLGLCDVLPGTAPTGTSWAQLAANAGAGINRWELRWDRLEAQPGQWDFTADDAAVASSQGAGLDVEGILIGTPGWAAAAGQRPGNGVPQGLYLDVTDPRNLWASYVRAVVMHYRGQVRAWEIWNESDLPFFWMGSPDDYLRLLKVSYLVIKSVDPPATVLMAGMVAPDFGFLTHVLDDAARDPASKANNGYFDAAAWHAYGPTQLLYTNITRFRSLLVSRGFTDVPLWVTEDGFPASNPNGEPRQAAYVLQTVAYAFAAGASRLLVYRASDDALPKTWGLLTTGAAPRMGYVAFQVAAQSFTHLRAITYLPGTHVERFALYQPAERITLLWNRGIAEQAVDIPAAGTAADVMDWMGQVTHIASTAGSYHLVLPGASYNAGVDPSGSVVGGPPVLLMENNQTPSGLTSRTYLAGLDGQRRTLAVLNHDSAPVALQVAASDHPAEHQVLHLPGASLQTVDLDLLAGQSYRGPYVVASSHPIAAQAASSSTATVATAPSTTWFVAAAPRQLDVGNPSSAQIHVVVDGYRSSGARFFHGSLVLGPSRTYRWLAPGGSALMSLVLHASQPVVVAGTTNALPHVDTTWYAIRPIAPRLSIFNPAGSPSRVDIQFVGSRTVTGQQLKLAPNRSFALRTHSARAVVVSANHGVAVGIAGRAVEGAPAATQATTESALAAAGPTTRVAVFNPSQQPAHVSYTLLSRTQPVRRGDVVVAPSHLYTLTARTATQGARGVIVRSDVPVVSAPAS